MSWNTANTAVLAEGWRPLISDPGRFDGVPVVGIDEHVWRHTRLGDKHVTVIIDLTPIRDGTGPSPLLDMVPCRSNQAFKQWLKDREEFATSLTTSPEQSWRPADSDRSYTLDFEEPHSDVCPCADPP